MERSPDRIDTGIRRFDGRADLPSAGLPIGEAQASAGPTTAAAQDRIHGRVRRTAQHVVSAADRTRIGFGKVLGIALAGLALACVLYAWAVTT